MNSPLTYRGEGIFFAGNLIVRALKTHYTRRAAGIGSAWSCCGEYHL
jgi:hypothetical protein